MVVIGHALPKKACWFRWFRLREALTLTFHPPHRVILRHSLINSRSCCCCTGNIGVDVVVDVDVAAASATGVECDNDSFSLLLLPVLSWFVAREKAGVSHSPPCCSCFCCCCCSSSWPLSPLPSPSTSLSCSCSFDDDDDDVSLSLQQLSACCCCMQCMRMCRRSSGVRRSSWRTVVPHRWCCSCW